MRSVCEAATGGLDLADPDVAPKLALLESWLARRVAILPTVREIRQSGFMVMIELEDSPRVSDSAALVALAARRRGVEASAQGDCVVVMASVLCSETDLRRLVAALASSIAEVAIGRLPTAA